MRTLLATLLSLIPAIAWGQDKAPSIPCGPSEHVLALFKEHFNEDKVFEGKMPDGKSFIVTLSPAGTFSVLIMKGPVACLATLGTDGQVDKGI